MINKIKGIVSEKTEKTVSITIFNSITFEFFVINSAFFELEQECTIYSAMLFSAERGYILYGFLELIQKQYFLVLQDCHGVGAKLALQILLRLSVSQIYDAIVTENKLIFESISGIGKKKAELIIIELKSKLTNLIVPLQKDMSSLHDDFVASLKALGYSQKEIITMVQAVYKENTQKDLTISQLIEQALVFKNNF